MFQRGYRAGDKATVDLPEEETETPAQGVVSVGAVGHLWVLPSGCTADSKGPPAMDDPVQAGSVARR
jgi:hypothetical protein